MKKVNLFKKFASDVAFFIRQAGVPMDFVGDRSQVMHYSCGSFENMIFVICTKDYCLLRITRGYDEFRRSFYRKTKHCYYYLKLDRKKMLAKVDPKRLGQKMAIKFKKLNKF